MSRPSSLALPAVLAGLLAQAVALFWLVAIPSHGGAGGRPHPRLPVLRVAPEAFEATAELGAPIALYGAGAFVCLIALLALGFGGGGALRAGRAAFALAAMGVAGCAVALGGAYLAWPRATAGLAGLPPGSAWLLFGLWPAEALFAWAYVRHFPTAIWPPSSEARFAALLAERAGAPEERVP